MSAFDLKLILFKNKDTGHIHIQKNHSLLVSYMENFSQSVILCECILTSHTRIYKKKKKLKKEKNTFIRIYKI